MSCARDHAIVGEVSADDDADVLARLAALDAEVKADAEKKRAETTRKAEIIAELRRREAAKKAAAAPKEEPKPVAAPAPAPVAAKPKPKPEKPKRLPAPEPDDVDVGDALETAMTVARGAKAAQKAKAELTKPREKHEKSWIASGLASTFFGPVGWLYAGSFRESIPAAFFYLVAAAIATKLPFFLIMPVLMVVMPISGIAGVVYALQYNRKGKRQRLFGKAPEEPAKQLSAGKRR
jgi:hypothetical protein